MWASAVELQHAGGRVRQMRAGVLSTGSCEWDFRWLRRCVDLGREVAGQWRLLRPFDQLINRANSSRQFEGALRQPNVPIQAPPLQQ